MKQLTKLNLQRTYLLEEISVWIQSTETAVVNVTNDLLMASDHGLIFVLVLGDFSASFDTVCYLNLLRP